MKKIFTLFFLALSAGAFAQSDEELVKQVVASAYVNGIQNMGPTEDIRKGFHPSFNMLRLIDNDIKLLPIEEWITNLEKNKAQNGPPKIKTEGKFVSVTVVGTAGNVVLELYREGKKTFTDNLLLYKFNEGWRIVAKTYNRHQ